MDEWMNEDVRSAVSLTTTVSFLVNKAFTSLTLFDLSLFVTWDI